MTQGPDNKNSKLLADLLDDQQLPSANVQRSDASSLLTAATRSTQPASLLNPICSPHSPSLSASQRQQMVALILEGQNRKASLSPPTEVVAQALFTPVPAKASLSSAAALPPPSVSSHPMLLPALASLAGRIAAELEASPQKISALNRTRRAAIAEHLDRLAGIQPPGAAQPTNGSTPPRCPLLERWINPARSPAQNIALKTYFEEVAYLTLAQALVLKAWSDRGIRLWREADLADMNWAYTTALKSHVPLDREGWQLTRANHYSWYKPEPALQQEIWRSLEGWRIAEEGPELITSLLRHPRHSDADSRELRGYDSRFFKSVWSHLSALGFDSIDSGLSSRRNAFSPTLRAGAMVRTSPENFQWSGFEANPFQLIAAELIQLWWGPTSPPAWLNGTGLEAHPRDQLSLSLYHPKPTLEQKLGEMEDHHLAFVLEERCVRLSQRNVESAQLKQKLDRLPYFKKLRGTQTSLGALQACVAITKLRPGGLLFWSREEPLRSSDGAEILSFLLEKGRLICEWDLSSVGHSLPTTAPLFPRYLYVFSREPDIQLRLAHHPIRVTVSGQIRSHIEVPLFFADLLGAAQSGNTPTHPRTQWQLHVHTSPSTQKEWAERWPDPATHETLRELDDLKLTSAPLASLSTIRPTPTPSADANGWVLSPNMRVQGLWIHLDPETKKLRARPLPPPGVEVPFAGFLIGVPDETWTAPLCRYLEGEKVSRWVDHHAERRGDRLFLTEQFVKFLPITKSLLRALGAPLPQDVAPEGSTSARDLLGEWEPLLSEISQPGAPLRIRDRLAELPRDERGSQIRATVFARACRIQAHQANAHSRVDSMIQPDGSIRWRELLKVLPMTELIPASLHPELRLRGNLPPHLPIGSIDRVKTPQPGVLLTTENGMTLHLGSDDSRLLEMIWAQLQGLRYPTWNELSQFLRLPRRIDVALATAEDVVRAHAHHRALQSELDRLIEAASDF